MQPKQSLAQYPRAFSASNYSGTIGAFFNPATLADSRHRFTFTPLAFYGEATNNYIKVQTPYNQWKALRGKLPDDLLDENGVPVFYDSYVKERLNGKSKQAYANFEITGPSFMFGLPNKMGIGFSTRTRFFADFKNLNEDLMKIFVKDFDTTYEGWSPGAHQIKYIHKPNGQNRFGAGAMAFQEFDFSFANVIYDRKAHFIKAGLTFKHMVGLGATYLSVNNLNYELLGQDSIQYYNPEITYARTSEQYYTDDHRLFDFFGKNRLGKGNALDLGFVYEFRPRYREYYYRMDKKRQEDRTANKYLFKVGASVSDWGKIRFTNPDYTRTLELYDDTFNVWTNFKSAKTLTSTHKIDTFALARFTKSDSSSEGFFSKLPTSLNLMFDYQYDEHIFFGATYIQTLRTNYVKGVRKQNSLSLNARYESRQLEAGTNLVIGKFYNKVLWGMYCRVGPFYMGTDNLGGIFTAKTTNGFNLYAGFQIPILQNRISDLDGDMVSDEKDSCPDVYGSETAKGCPDEDGDGVPDDIDYCPFDPGEKKTHGCPDPDNDGLALSDDKCPDKPGLKENEGCPDSDNDGLADHKDRCPDEAGPVENEGCPEDKLKPAEENPNEKVAEKPEEKKTEEAKTENPKNDDPKKDPVVTKEKEEPKTEQTPVVEKPKTQPVKTNPPTPVVTKPSETKKSPDDLTVRDIVGLMKFNEYDYYLILGVYESKELADLLVKRLNKEAGVLTYIYFDEQNGLNYVTFGRATDRATAEKQLDELDRPAVNRLINGHVWWKKVPK